MKGLYQKYYIEKANGDPIDPKAKYLVLRYDKEDDPYCVAARETLSIYANKIKNINPKFSNDLSLELLDWCLDRFKKKENKEKKDA